jgi:HD-GYP domain-containing protein (c-di-GMP phosphodiesterase class II)
VKNTNIEQVEPGEILGKTIFSSNGTILLSAGVQLTVYMINTLKRIGATMIYIKDPSFEDIDIPEVLSDETKRLVLRKMTETFDSIRSGKNFDTRAIGITVEQVLEDVVRSKEVLLQLSDIRTKDNQLYVHAMNVCLIATMIGMNMGLNQVQLKELSIGAMLHDIGKVERITDDECGDPKRHHTWRGFDLLKQKQELNLMIAHVALQHHEQPDGEGFPRKLVGDQIHLYAQIVTVANMYDNLLFDMTKSKQLLPHEACERMMAMSGTKLDREVLVQFMRTVSIYPTGSSVRLSTKETGVVVGQHRGLPGRPVIRVVRYDTNDEIMVNEVDLAKETTVFVDLVLS